VGPGDSDPELRASRKCEPWAICQKAGQQLPASPARRRSPGPDSRADRRPSRPDRPDPHGCALTGMHGCDTRRADASAHRDQTGAPQELDEEHLELLGGEGEAVGRATALGGGGSPKDHRPLRDGVAAELEVGDRLAGARHGRRPQSQRLLMGVMERPGRGAPSRGGARWTSAAPRPLSAPRLPHGPEMVDSRQGYGRPQERCGW